MKYSLALKWLLPLIACLGLLAAGLGLFSPASGEPYAYTNHRGEQVTINGRGLYQFDTVSTAAQMQGNDLIALFVGVPLLAIAGFLALRGSLRARLLLSGTLGFFLYTYLSMATLCAFNALFLVYVILFSASLFAFILCMLSFDLGALPLHFSPHLPRGWIAGFLWVTAGFLALAWLARILAPLMQGTTPALENTTTLVIQTLDLGLIVPFYTLSAFLLLRRSAIGLLLASVALLKGLTMGLGVSAMGINMLLAGVPDSMAILIPFLVITAAGLALTLILLAHIHEQPSAV
jgi:hypothetical protein